MSSEAIEFLLVFVPMAVVWYCWYLKERDDIIASKQIASENANTRFIFSYKYKLKYMALLSRLKVK
jgi:hypothetical protein